MPDYGIEVLSLIAAYLLGAVPFGILAGRLKGVDIRAQGSGNLGATNVSRVLGRPWGTLVFALDALKGALPVLLVQRLVPGPAWAVGAGLAAILGHVFPVYLGFRGGKGVATSAGTLLALAPLATAAAFALWLTVVGLTRMISAGSLAAAAALPIAHFALGGDALVGALTVLVTLLVWLRHRGNIARILKGTESKLGMKVNHGHTT